MLKRFIFSTLAAAILAFGSAGVAMAQAPGAAGALPGFGSDPQGVPGPTPDVRGAFETSLFEYDARLFAPLTLDEIQNKRDKPSGFYFTYDRTYLSVSRPDPTTNVNAAAVATGQDFVWGNRFDFGFVQENQSGWGMQILKSEGSFFSTGQDILVPNPFMTNNTFTNIEVSRFFRQELSSGATFEPYFGFRYQGINDDTIEDSIVTFQTANDINRFTQFIKNDSFGGHVRARYSRPYGRWTYRVDTALAAGYNSQRYTATDIVQSGATITVFESTFENSGFTPTLDLSVDAAYALTRDVNLRAGVQIYHVWAGILRADTRRTSLNPFSAFDTSPSGITSLVDQSYSALGFTFGVEWRR